MRAHTAPCHIRIARTRGPRLGYSVRDTGRDLQATCYFLKVDMKSLPSLVRSLQSANVRGRRVAIGLGRHGADLLPLMNVPANPVSGGRNRRAGPVRPSYSPPLATSRRRDMAEEDGWRRLRRRRRPGPMSGPRDVAMSYTRRTAAVCSPSERGDN